ncbi:MAG: ferritin-like domain-containing protein [Chitinophagaceae bacterium]
MNDLRDLLKHEVIDLHSAEEQIIKAMPAMIKKARNAELKQSLQQHLKVTEAQLTRLQKVQKLLDGQQGSAEESGLLSRLFKRSHTCRGMQGIIDEGEKIMAEDMSPEVMDAAILAASQKIEHYEICGYGTARAYAEELGLTEVATLLEQTLDEEYEADDKLTALAVNRLNEQAEKRTASTGRSAGTGSSRTEGARTRATREEPEMAMASAKRGSTQSSGNTRSTSGNGRSGSTGNTTGASSTRATKTSVKSSSTRGGNNTGGRGNNSGRS